MFIVEHACWKVLFSHFWLLRLKNDSASIPLHSARSLPFANGRYRFQRGLSGNRDSGLAELTLAELPLNAPYPGSAALRSAAPVLEGVVCDAQTA